MSKTIEIKVPVTTKQKELKLITVEGRVAWFQIGQQRIKFLIQNCGLRGVQLTHFASGMTTIRSNVIDAKKVQSYHGGKVYTTREACRQCLGDLERKVGLSKMLTTFASAEIVNK